MSEQQNLKMTDRLVRYLVLGLLSLPLILIPTNIDLSYALRSGLIITFALLCALYSPLRQHMVSNFMHLSRLQRLSVSILGIAMLVSSVVSKTNGFTTIFGYRSDYLGLLLWLSCGVLALTIGAALWRQLKSNTAAYIVTVSSALSIATYSYSYSWVTDRLGGVFFLATNSGIWASIGIILSYELFVKSSRRKNQAKWLLLCAINFVPLVLSESRVSFLVVLIFMVVILFRRVRVLSKVPLIVAGCFSVLTIHLLGSIQTTSQDIIASTGYRIDLYQATLLLIPHHIIGVGPSAGDTIINSAPHLSPELVKTLKSGYVFLYAHNLVIDVGLMFGLVALFALLFLLVACFLKLIALHKHPDFWLMLMTCITLFANAMVNVPNNVLSCLFFVALIAVLVTRIGPEQQKLPVAKHRKMLGS